MSDLGLNTIAQLLYATEQSIDFARTVAELGSVLSRLQPDQVQFAWDCDDFVCFDIPGTRIQLAWAEVDMRGYKACLSIAVGPDGTTAPGLHEDLCSRLVDRIKNRYEPVAVLWCQVDGPVNVDVIDELQGALPHLNKELPDIDTVLAALDRQEARLSGQVMPLPNPRARAARKIVPKPIHPPICANDHPEPLDPALDTIRRALYPDDTTRPVYSVQMRLAVHCLNATLILVWAPMGAALMTYSILRGEDMRLSSRVMAITGTLLAFAHSPLGFTVAAMARSIN